MGRLALVGSLALLFWSCSDVVSPLTLSDDDAAEVYVDATIQPILVAPIAQNAVDSLVNRNAQCQHAGSLTVNGTIVRETVALSAVFTGCQPLRFTLDGTITIEGTADTLSGRLNWHGFLTISGPSAGQCWLDVLLVYTPTTQEITGTVCGADASGLRDAAKRTGLS